jgi:hypothetical protein
MPSDFGPNDIVYEEVFGESRSFTINRQTVTKDFVFRVSSDWFVDWAESHYLPGTDLEMLYDDKVMQQQLLPIFYGVVPMIFMFYISETEYQLLYCASLSAKQINWTTWEIKVTYDIPDDNGSNQGGGSGGATGPSDGEQNSTKFTQVSFNGSVTTEKIQKARVVECQRAKNRPSTEALPYTNGSYGIIGYSEDGIEGAEVYVRSFKFQITQYMPPTMLTYSYIRRLSRLMTCLNNKPFFGFAPGSVMFMGYSGEGDLYQAVPVTLEFEVKPNFKFSDTTEALANPNDEIEYVGGKKVIVTTNQFDTIYEPEFPSTQEAAMVTSPAGVHPGWSIVSYEYAPQILSSTRGRVIRVPSHRTILKHYKYVDYIQFQL